MSTPASSTGGVGAFPIGGRVISERERLHGAGMSAEEREWRKKWVKDQELAHDEPRVVPEYWLERTNPIRRFYMAPLDAVHRALTPAMVSKNQVAEIQ